MARRRRGSSLTRQAQNLSTLRFGPELGALAQLLGEAKLQRSQAISGAKGGARMMTQALQGLRPQIDQTYQTAGTQRGIAQQEADAAFAGLSGPVVEAIKAGRAREAALAAESASRAQSAAQTEVGQRIGSAHAGAIGERRLAEQRYRQDVGKIGERLTGLKREQGAFLESTLQDLTEKQRQAALDEAKFDLELDKFQQDIDEAELLESERAFRRRATRRTSEEVARHNRAMERKGGGRGGKPTKGLGSLTAEQEGAHVDQIESAANWARQLRAAGLTPQQIRQRLLKGVDQTAPSGKKIKIPAYKPMHVNVALDLAYHKRATKPNVRRLHSRGVHVPGRWRGKKRAKKSTPQSELGQRRP